ncbi:hypothetical protein B0H13DRAFT_1927915 [Mycena leptocephala]|nr:hypothetical protein B0H13DRAFT_1927915 [Mycena leptocephala]
MSEAVLQPPEVELDFDVWELVLRKHTGPDDTFNVQWLQKTQYTCQGFAKILRPLIYRHVNLRCIEDAISFFATISQYPSLAGSVRTLQFSFDMDGNPELGRYPYSDDESSSEDGRSIDSVDSSTNSSATSVLAQPEHEVTKQFWASFIENIPKLVQLATLSVSYSHSDMHFLHRLLLFGDLKETLPSSVQKMHLKPLPEDYDLEGEDLISTFAWNSAFWRLDISLIPHICTLILTTPSYVIWPPTTSQFKLTIAEWTAQFRHKTESQLNEIIINFAFNDEGVLVEKWAEETGKEVGDVYEDKRAVGGGYGTQIVLCPNSKKKKTWDSVTIFHSSKSNREEYFFGREGRDYMYPWLYLDEVKAAKKWRKSQSDFSGVPGNFVVY